MRDDGDVQARLGTVRTVFLDRDGVINRRLPGDYVTRWDEFEFLPGAVEAIGRLKRGGLVVVVVTNQRGVALGRMTMHDVDSIHDQMRHELRARGADVDAVYVCPDADGPMRKPAPGMLLAAAREVPGVVLDGSVMVGDSLTDLMAGAAAGCARGVLVVAPSEREHMLQEASTLGVRVDSDAPSLLEAVEQDAALRAAVGGTGR